MKNKTVLKAVSAGLIILMLSCNTKKEKPFVVDKEQIKEEIQAKENAFAGTYNAGEVINIGYYADDAISYYQNRAPLIGKEAIAAFLKSDLKSNSNTISFKTGEIFVSNDGNQVVELGSYSVRDSSDTAINTGNYMSLFEKRNGKYVCVRDMSASDGQ
jgi:ketosteroid isomerase-like protein